MRYTEQDVRAVEATVTWEELCKVFGGFKLQLSRQDGALLSRGVVLKRAGAVLVDANSPDGEYDSPRLPDNSNQIFGGNDLVALRHRPEVQPRKV